MPSPGARQPLVIVAIVVIMVSTASAILGLRAGHPARAASTFFAGLAFSILFWSRSRRNAG